MSTPTAPAGPPLVGVIMGSRSDWETLRHCSDTLTELGVPHECVVVSAHRTPDWLMEYAGSAEARGLQVIVAGAGGVPVGTLAIGKAGAINAGLMAASILGVREPRFREALRARRAKTTADVLANRDPRVEPRG